MTYQTLVFSILTSVTLVLGQATDAAAQHSAGEHSPDATEQTQAFQPIEQPLWAKVVVTGAGLGLIGAELWWFVLSKPGSPKTGRE